ncbi:DUF4347 domain-containing protein [Oxynema aestuarii]|uniref:DUF4347 domain-containing protein n=1 Tax=Oxynema aestuarii AP17 TaxID=2064643 RepID=A0A6H1TUU5_9CYAN|nr:DUF4347 domain-containing protein [Oxynema aestuarii]QIZ69533.1 DUF4347 domain-containing protein [Oxynema aestuarii AP17]
MNNRIQATLERCQATTATKIELVFIDLGIENPRELLAGVRPGSVAIALDRDRNGIEQIAETIEQYGDRPEKIGKIHIFAHGRPGEIELGNRKLNQKSFSRDRHHLERWVKGWSEDGELHLYGCRVAGDRGQNFLYKLAKFLGVNIAASEHLIGKVGVETHWNLEFATGKIERNFPLEKTAIANYTGVLAMLNVTNTNDSGAGSLRAAIAQALPGDTIVFDSNLSNSTIRLSSGQLEINKNLIIDGANAPGLTISGNNASRVFDVKNDVNFNPVTFTLRNAIVADGKTTQNGEEGAGAGIRTDNRTTLIVENSQFINNFANGEGGGAIFGGWRSKNTIANSRFEGNGSSGNGTSGKTERGGGAIAVKSESQTTVTDSEFTNNQGTLGGAINTLLGGLTVETSIFLNNDSLSNGGIGYGGAIYTDGASDLNDPDSGTIAIRNSHFEGNTGQGQGGALFLYVYNPDRVVVENSTIVNNTVLEAANGDALGGGVRIGNGDVRITNTTIANNRAYSQGGGLWLGESATLSMVNSTFSGNRAESADGNSGLGGAMMLNHKDGFNATIDHTTVANNYAGFQGGAFWGNGNRTTLSNSIFDRNTAGNGGNDWNNKQQTGVELIDGGNNLQFPPKNPDDGNDVNITANVTIADPKLGPLQDNGAGILTHALLDGSPALNAGASSVTTDQRGVSRNQPDIGSFEQFSLDFVETVSTGEEPTEGSLAQDVQVQLTQALDFDLNIPYRVTGGTATANSDFTEPSGLLTIPAGATTAAISLPILADGEAEAAETVQLSLTPPSGGVYGLGPNRVHTHTIAANSTTALPVPANPSRLVATAQSATAVQLSWQDNSDSETGFKLERSPDNTTWEAIATTEANITSYLDSGLAADRQYYYRLSAIGDGSRSDLITAEVTTPVVENPVENPTDHPIAPMLTDSDVASGDGSDPQGLVCPCESLPSSSELRQSVEPPGSDRAVVASANDDFYWGTPENEAISGLDGFDYLLGMEGGDRIEGDGGNDLLHGNIGNDWLDGGVGDDTLFGGKDDDLLFGGGDNDALFGDWGNDTLFADDGDDFLNGNRQNDWLYGGGGNDTIHGGKQNDTLMGEWGDDTLFGDLDDDLVCGNEGRDVLLGNVGKDVLCGGLDDDTVYGGKDDDVLFGEAGDDVLSGDLGNDIVVGGAGRDRFVLREDGGHDVIVDFEVGVDLLALSGGLTPDAVEFVAGDRGTIVRLAGGDRLLATLENVSADELSTGDLTLI